MDRLFFLLCLFVSLIQISFVIYLYNRFWKHAPQSVIFLINIFFYVNLYKLIFNGFLVDISRIVSNGSVNNSYAVTAYEIFEIYLIEFLSNLIYYFVFTLALNLVKRYFNKTFYFSIKHQSYTLLSICILYLLNISFPSIFSDYLWLIKASIDSIGPICALILLVIGIKNNRIYWVLLGGIPLIISIILSLIAGLRGTTVGITIYFLIITYLELNKKQFKKTLLIGILPFLILISIQSKLGEIKYAFASGVANGSIDITSFNGYVIFVKDILSNNLVSNSLVSENKSIVEEFEYRYGAPSLFAVGFLKYVEKYGYVGSNPISNSFYSFLPRQLLNSDKPFPGSVNGDEKTMGMYVCINEVTGGSNMSDFFVGGHFFWEFGLLGVIILSSLSAFYNIVIIFISRKLGYFGVALLILSFKPFWILSKLWTSEIFIMIPTVILPSLLLYKLFISIYRIKLY